MGKKFLSLFVLMLFLSLAPCLAAVPDYFHTAGTIQSGRYTSPGLFSIKLPRFLNPPFANEEVLQDSKEITFNDCTGTLLHITYVYLGEDMQKRMTEHKEVIPRLLNIVFEKCTLPPFYKLFPTAQILQKKELTLNDGRPALFALMLLPEGNLLEDPNGREKFDVMRSILLFPLETRFLILSHQSDLASILRHQSQTGDGLTEEEHLALLLEAAHSCKPEPLQDHENNSEI